MTDHEVINLYFDVDGMITKVPFNSNAVIVHLFPEADYDGNLIYKRVVTIACVDQKDKKLMAELSKEAHRILYGEI